MGSAISILKANPGPLALSVGVPLTIASGLGQWAFKDIKGWYTKLKKPNWTPPNAAFPVVWTALYSLAGAAAVLVLKNDKGIRPNGALWIYGAQLALNLAWQPLFFKAHKLDVALVDSTAMLGAAVATTVSFSRVCPTAGIMFAPNIAWIMYATALNAWILKHNPNADSIPSDGGDAADVQMATTKSGKLE